MSKSQIIVFSGASGVGKSTVLKQVMAARPDLRFSVSATTRSPRAGEVDGVHYFFVTRERFQEMIAGGELLEHDEHFGNLYGTPVSQVTGGGKVVLDVEPNGAFNVRRLQSDATLIFIMPPSIAELEQRLRSRGDTSPEQIAMRLDRARWEMEQGSDYDYVVVNDDFSRCAKEILNIIAEKADE